MIRIELPDLPAADRLVEALYIAAGQHPGTVLARRWLALAADVEAGIDALPPTTTAVRAVPDTRPDRKAS